jgi:hypothetical protein
VLACHDELQRRFPNNRFIDRRYRRACKCCAIRACCASSNPAATRTDIPPVFIPLVDFSATARFVSATQATRVALETWASFDLCCLECVCDALDPAPNDTPVADFKCFVCERIFQLKAKDGRFGLRITGAAYQRTVDGDLRISDIATLLKHAHKAATYKPALLKGYRRSNTSVNATDRNPAGSVKDPRFVP